MTNDVKTDLACISSIVDYVLDVHKVKVSWRIVCLDDKEWRKIMEEKSALDTASYEFWKRIPELLHAQKNDIDPLTVSNLREAIRLAKQSTVEYGTVPSLADYLAANAMVVHVNTMLNSEKWPPGHLQPFTLEMAKKNRHMDFLIFINSSSSSSFSNASHDEKLNILAHEALHIVNSVRNLPKSSVESIETRAEKLVSDFKKRARK